MLRGFRVSVKLPSISSHMAPFADYSHLTPINTGNNKTLKAREAERRELDTIG